jgi:hypothetical protein
MARSRKSSTASSRKTTAAEPKVTAAEIKAGGHAATDEEVHESLADLGPESPASMRELAEDLPEKDEVQVATKEQILALDMQEAAQKKVEVVEASPNAADTPSGHALIETADIAHDGDRGEAYARAKAEKRWGWSPPEES